MTIEHGPDQQAINAADTSTDEGRMARHLEAKLTQVWDVFQNSALLHELEQLSPEDKKHIDELAREIVEHDSYFVAMGKPHGIPPFPGIATEEHFSFTVNLTPQPLRSAGGPREIYKYLGLMLKRRAERLKHMDQPAQEAISNPEDAPDNIKVLPWINKKQEVDPDRVMLKCNFGTPAKTSLIDASRGTHNHYALMVPANGKVMEALRSGGRKAEDVRFALRNAAVIINPDVAVAFDAPIGNKMGADKSEQSFFTVDFINRAITRPGTNPQKVIYDDYRRFREACIQNRLADGKSYSGKVYDAFGTGGGLIPLDYVKAYEQRNPRMVSLRQEWGVSPRKTPEELKAIYG